MSIKAFESLTSSESNLLLQAPALIAVLIASADQEIDEKETSWASKLVKYRSFTASPLLQEYYTVVGEHFEESMESLVENWESLSKFGALTEQLKATNPVLGKLDPAFAEELKKSWRSLAKKVAEADGGLFGFASVNKEEKALMDLPMID